MPHISIIDWAFRCFMQNYTNMKHCRCKISKIKIGNKEIDPDMFNRTRVGNETIRTEGVWS